MGKEIQPIYTRCQAVETLDNVLMHILDHSENYIPQDLKGYRAIKITIRMDADGLPTIETLWEEVDSESYLKAHGSYTDEN